MGAETVNKPTPVVPTSQPRKSLKEMTEEERKVAFAELRSRLSRSRIEVVGDPDNPKVYYWARKNDTEELTRLEWMGYTVVHDNPQAPKLKASGLQADGTYVIGDVILMEIDPEIKEFLDAENARRAHELVEGAKSDFVEGAQKMAEQGYRVPTFERGEDPHKVVFHK